MKAFRSLNISTKLTFSALAFALPVAVLAVFMDLSFRYDIRIAQTERLGIRHIRAAAPLMRLAAEHHYLLALAGEDDKAAWDKALKIQEQIDSLLNSLEVRHLAFVRALRDAPAGTLEVLRQKPTPQDLRKAWALALRGDDLAAEQFLSTLRQFFRGVADVSQLSVDPALDSAYLVDTVIFAVHGSLADQYKTRRAVFQHLMGLRDMDPGQRDSLDHHINSHEDDLLFLLGGARGALMMDASFYGLSAGLQNRFKTALESYQSNAEQLINILRRYHATGSLPGDFNTVCDRTVTDLETLFDVGLDELDTLIAKRLASYQTWRAMGYGTGALALALAGILLLVTYRGVTRSINEVRHYAGKVREGDLDAAVPASLSGEMGELADAISLMVQDLKHKIGTLDGILTGLTVPCLVVDIDQRLTFINQPYLDLYERDGAPEDYLGQNLGEFYYGDPNHDTLTGRAIREDRPYRVDEVEGTTLKGNPVFVRYDSAPIHDLDGNLTGAFAVVTDLTKLKAQQDRILFDATHDALTGLPNRVLFADRVRRAGEQAAEGAGGFAVLLMDMDNFKQVNDSLGHGLGDELILGITERLSGLGRPCRMVARLGGDEFGLLMAPVDGTDQAMAQAARVHALFAEPFTISELEIFATVGIGVVHADDARRDHTELLRDADTAMYRAKAEGAGRSRLFDRAMHDEIRERLEMENDMKRGVERDEFTAFYQPIVNLSTGRISGFEALVRWNHPERGLIPPGRFIPLAEENGLVVPMGTRMLELALAQASLWRREIQGFEDLTISVNLAVPQLMRPDMAEVVGRTLAQTGMPPAQVKLEITESGLMGNASQALKAQQALKALGVTLSIDDFGTGYSSLSYLSRFPFDFLKVDQSFVFTMAENEQNMEIVRSIVSLAHSLGKRIIAEGVETPEHLALLRALGCEYGQGYLFARPLPADQARALLEKNPTW